MPEKARRIIGAALLTATALIFIWVSSQASRNQKPEATAFRAGNRPAQKTRAGIPDGWLSVNDAETEDLIQLKGIGETIAENLISEREKNGIFYYPEDLLAVKGIGTAKLEQIRDELNFSLPEEEEIGE